MYSPSILVPGSGHQTGSPVDLNAIRHRRERLLRVLHPHRTPVQSLVIATPWHRILVSSLWMLHHGQAELVRILGHRIP